MQQIIGITDEPHQRHTIQFEESEIVLILRFCPTIESWMFDYEYKSNQGFGYKLSLNVTHMISRNLPFDFIVRDMSGTGLDPFRLDDFSTDRCRLYLLESDDMEELRDGPVPI